MSDQERSRMSEIMRERVAAGVWETAPPELPAHSLVIEEAGAAWRLRYHGAGKSIGQIFRWREPFATMEAAIERAMETALLYQAKGHPSPGIYVVREVRQ